MNEKYKNIKYRTIEDLQVIVREQAKEIVRLRKVGERRRRVLGRKYYDIAMRVRFTKETWERLKLQKKKTNTPMAELVRTYTEWGLEEPV